MKKTISTLLLLLSGIFSASLANAECPAGKIYACRVDACGFSDCKCVSQNQLQNWLATVPPCNWKPPKWWVRMYQPDAGMENSLQVYPNPVSTSTTISFSLGQSQNVSVRIVDMNGRLVSTLADDIFEAGENALMWSTDNVSSGIYLLQLQSEEHQERIKLVVTK